MSPLIACHGCRDIKEMLKEENAELGRREAALERNLYATLMTWSD